jgi:hypothetical protein
MTPVESGPSGRETFTIDPDLFKPPWETRPWGAGVDTIDPERFRTELERSTSPGEDPKGEGPQAEGRGADAPGGTAGATGLPPDTAADVLNKQRITAWLKTWRGLKEHAEALRGSPDPNLKRLGDALKRQADALGDNPPAPAPTPLGFRGELKSETPGVGPGPGAMAALVFSPADASRSSSLAVGLEADPEPGRALDLRQAMQAQADVLQASSTPGEAQLGRALRMYAEKPPEHWSNPAFLLGLALGVDPLIESERSGAPASPPPVRLPELGYRPPADVEPSPPDPRPAARDATWRTAESWAASKDSNLNRLAPWLKWQAQLLWNESGAKEPPPAVVPVDPRTGTFEFTGILGRGSSASFDDEDGEPIITPNLLLISTVHVEAGGQADHWALLPSLMWLQRLGLPGSAAPGAPQIILETRIVESPAVLRSLDSWTSRWAWENAVQRLPAERSEGFDTSSLPPFTLSNINLLSSTLASARCHQALCTKPDCTHSEIDQVRNVAPVPGLRPADWPSGAPQPLAIDLDEAAR